MRPALLLMVAVALAPAPAPAADKVTKIAVFKLRAERNVDPGLANVLLELVLAAVQRTPAYSAISENDLNDLLTLERRKQLLGCEEDSCMAEISGALGVERILAGTISRLGSSITVSLRLVNAANPGEVRRETGQAKDEEAAGRLVESLLVRLLGAPTDRGRSEPATSEGVGRLAVFTNPAGADVFVDSKNRGGSPLTLDNLAAGQHVLTVGLRDYVQIVEHIDVAAGRETRVVRSLVRQTGDLDVSTNPTGAKLYLDDAYKGDTPLQLGELPTGTYRLRLVAKAHEPFETEVKVPYGSPVRLSPTLTPKPGPILFITQPEGAEVWVDGDKRGSTNTSLDLTATAHQVSLILEGYVVETQKLSVQPGEAATVSVMLKPGPTVRPRQTPFPWHWLWAGGGAVGLGTSAVLAGVALSTRGAARELAAGDPGVPDLVARGKREAAGADVALVVGALCTSVAYLLWPARDDGEP